MNSQLVLIDTNILIYASDESSVFQEKARRFLEKKLPFKNLCLTIQNLTEFYAIVTNPKRVKNSLNQNQAIRAIKSYLNSGLFQIIIPKPATVFRITALLDKYLIKNREIHDLHLAAVMMDNEVKTIYTADTKIFNRLGLRAINPLK